MSRVLIVEDEEAIAEIEKDYLELSDLKLSLSQTVHRDWQPL